MTAWVDGSVGGRCVKQRIIVEGVYLDNNFSRLGNDQFWDTQGFVQWLDVLQPSKCPSECPVYKFSQLSAESTLTTTRCL